MKYVVFAIQTARILLLFSSFICVKKVDNSNENIRFKRMETDYLRIYRQ